MLLLLMLSVNSVVVLVSLCSLSSWWLFCLVGFVVVGSLLQVSFNGLLTWIGG